MQPVTRDELIYQKLVNARQLHIIWTRKCSGERQRIIVRSGYQNKDCFLMSALNKLIALYVKS